MAFRAAGITSDNFEELGRFFDLLRVNVPPDLRDRMRSIACPAKNPHTVFTYLDNATPPLTVEENQDGSVLIVDGDLFCLDYHSGQDTDGVDAVELLKRLSADPLGTLDALDAAAFIMFFDARSETTYIARDAIGNVPAYCCSTHRRLVWSSDLGTLTKSRTKHDINLPCVDFFVASGYVPAPWTFVRDIQKIKPGYVCSRSRRRDVVARRYLNYHVPSIGPLSQSEIIERIAVLFPKAVRRRVRDPARVGLLLSSGVDSKTVLGVMSKIGITPKTFTFRYRRYAGDLNESESARACASHFGAEHFDIDVDPLRIPGLIGDLLEEFGEPFSYGLHTVMLDELAEHGVSEVLCGTGADGAWFLGDQQIGAIKFHNLPATVKALLTLSVNAANRAQTALKMAGILIDRPPVKGFRPIWTAQTGRPGLLGELITPLYFRRKLYKDTGLAARLRLQVDELFSEAVRETADLQTHQQLRILQTRFYGADMMQNWNHWSGRKHGLTIQAPYYDRETLAFLLSQPMMQANKAELRKYASTLMPREAAYSPKLAQSVPLPVWIRGPLREWVRDTLSKQRLQSLGLFNPAAVARLLDDFYDDVSLPNNASWTIWNLTMITLWYERLTRSD